MSHPLLHSAISSSPVIAGFNYGLRNTNLPRVRLVGDPPAARGGVPALSCPPALLPAPSACCLFSVLYFCLAAPLLFPKKDKAYPIALRMYAASLVPPGGFSGGVRSMNFPSPLVL